MTLEGNNSALIIYIIFIVLALAASYFSGYKMIKMTGYFGSQVFLACVINLFLVACAVFGWFLGVWGSSEALFYGGLVLGGCLFIVSEAALITTMYLRRDQLQGTEERAEEG
ncbi:hypothetical protein [Virgibacillus ihumii]|uniref:hypothetical protein n=1 Tax=Virgibacillus ihumii TaxID=2686091 RepID=UPI00157E268B|nr:hypothetical protein [Virgibacillus ihumii]